MTISDALKAAYRYHRNAVHSVELATFPRLPDRDGFKSSGSAALQCIGAARKDVAAGKARYPATDIFPAVSWQAPDDARPRSSERLAYVDSLGRAGLRMVGRVLADHPRDLWNNRGTESGWITDAYGETSEDGTGLCWGVVCQLPGRNGKARFVAGYQFGGTDGGTDAGPTLDLGTIYESESARGDDCKPQDHEDARDAARVADSMARIAAEAEREYQTASAAGSRWYSSWEELADNRATVLATIRELKGACQTIAALPETIKARIRSSIESDLDTRSGILARMARLAEGEFQGLIFWNGDERLKAAFNEGACRKVL